MFSLLKRALGPLICLGIVLVIALPSFGDQLSPAQQSASGNGTNPANGSAGDPLGRNTPSGTLYGFLQAAQSGNYSIAAQYLQISAARRQTQGGDLASKLKVVIDRSFSGDYCRAGLRRKAVEPHRHCSRPRRAPMLDA